MMKRKSHFKFTKQERRGIFFLLLIIVLLQGAYFFVKWNAIDKDDSSFEIDEAQQAAIDSLKAIASKKKAVKTYPFNPNFITDYKGYALGMSPEEIDRLHKFREKNLYVNSAAEFQQVTHVSDSLLNAISPYFKFPDWVVKRKKSTINNKQKLSSPTLVGLGETVTDLNSATAEQLRSIHGIGEKLSARIVKFRNRLGGFMVNEQLYDVYGLEPEVVERALEHFQVLHPPEIKKIDVNTASIDELASLAYIRYGLAERIIDYRQQNGRIDSLDELAAVEGFPKEKIARIGLYLLF
ncbi:helix-hairpin-helix domain-containing protein [Allomuricauda sp. d1]|uniref:ComEA family DNA-binding protein n=1 Tax=Allomuricauda sp. d1 TaxID=3136725 RepID=UPI0031DA2C45